MLHCGKVCKTVSLCRTDSISMPAFEMMAQTKWEAGKEDGDHLVPQILSFSKHYIRATNYFKIGNQVLFILLAAEGLSSSKQPGVKQPHFSFGTNHSNGAVRLGPHLRKHRLSRQQ